LSITSFRVHAEANRLFLGWTSIPLVLDKQGLPKKPINNGWPKFTTDDVPNLDWGMAVGIGIVLGPASKNLAVIDVDDVELAEEIFALPRYTLMVRTGRGRGHVYLYEDKPSASSARKIQYHGRTVGIELKAMGTQVASPPTPGYSQVHGDLPPARVASIAVGWEQLANALGIDPGATESAGFPRPWAGSVTQDVRNKSAYIEAHKLREAGMGLPLALRYMQLRWEQDYAEGDQAWLEVERTIRSAYAKGMSHGSWSA